MADLRHLQSWEDKVAWARSRCDASLAKVDPKLQGIPDELPLGSRELLKSVLTAREIEITENYPITDLLSALRERKLSVEEVTRAFLRRAALAHAATNCLVELMWDEAIARAKHLDSLPEPMGALFGLPISTKEHHGMVGPNVATTASFVAWIGKGHGSNLLYDSFWDEGCVFYARTAQPQTIMHLETNSNIYGRTVNPYNRELTSGGSSGGESALLGMRGSILLCLRRDQYRAAYARAWTETATEDGREVDVILCPPSFGAATPHDQSRYWGYTANWNLLDYPAAVFPVTTVDPVKDAKEVDYVPVNDDDRFVYDMYTPEKYANAPVSLQIVGRRQYDEKVLVALVEIEHALGRE